MKTSKGRVVGLVLVGLAAVGLVGVGVASCNAPHPAADGSGDFNTSQASSDSRWNDCVPPLACGPFYAGYVPSYYALHPLYPLLTPYQAFYSPVIVNHRMTVVRPASTGTAPITSRVPYPAGYKPVPDSFKAPTASGPKAPSVPSAPKIAPKAPTIRTRSK